MNTVNSLKRPLTGTSDSCKLLVCKTCKKDEPVVLNLKTCGCLFCESCDGDSLNKCISCDSEVDPKIKLTFTKKLRCKFYERNKCYSFAEYKCKCLNFFVCELCLNFVHRKRVSGSCDPEVLTSKVTNSPEPCQSCKEFIAEFKMTSAPYSKICFNCSTNSNSECIPYVTNPDEDLGWDQFYKDFVQSSQMASDKIKKTEEVLELVSWDREQKIKICKDLITEIQKCLDEYTEIYDRHILTLKQQLENSKKDYLRPDGTAKTILDLLKNKELTLHGENGKEQIINFLNYYREKNNYNPVTEQIKTLLSSFDSAKLGLSVDSVGVSDNGVKPLAILIEKPFTLNERKKILEAVRKHEDKWVRKEIFAVNDTVIIFDANSTDMFKCKRAKVLNKGNHNSTVFLLDFGFEITVQNSSIGLISHPEVPTNGKKTCFLAQFTGSVNVNCGLKQQDWISEISEMLNDENSESTSVTEQIAVNTEVVERINICVGELKAPFPAKIGHYSYINNKLYAHVKYYKYYEKPEMLELHNHGNYPKVNTRDPTADIGSEVRKINIAKRGARVWSCPYCKSYTRTGDKQAIFKHMNERNEKDARRRPACPVRRDEEPKVNNQWTPAKKAPIRLSI